MTGRRLFKRILKGYIAVALVFTVVFGICVYMSDFQRAKKSFDADVSDALNRIVRTTDIQLGMLKKITTDLSNDSAVLAYALSDDESAYEQVQRAIRVNTEGFGTQGVNVYISKFSSSLEKVIGGNQVMSGYNFLTSYQFSSGSNEVIRQYFLKDENAGRALTRYCVRPSSGNSGTLMTIEKRVVDGSDIYIIYTIDVDSIKSSIMYPGSSLAILDGQNMICNIGENTFKTSDSINNVLKKRSTFSLKSGTELIDGYLYKTLESDAYKWSYTLAVPLDGLYASAWQIFFVILAVCCVIMLVSWCVLILVTRLVYSPVNATMKFLSKYSDDSSADEGLFIRQSFVHMSNDNTQLTEKLEAAWYPLRTKFLKDLLFGLAGENEIASYSAELEPEDISGPYRVVLLKFANFDSLTEVFSKENIDKIKFQIKEFIDDQLKSQIIHGALDIDCRTIAVISYGNEVRQLRELLADMAMMVQGSFDVEVVGAVGNDCEKLTEICYSYESSCRIMENRFSVGCRNAIVTQEDVNAANTDGFYYPLNAERELITEVIRARSEEVHKILDNILEENFVKRTLTKDRMNAFAFAITASVNRIVESLNKTTNEVFGEGNIVFLDLKMCTDSKTLSSKVYEVFDKIIAYINMENKLEQDNLSDLLLEYIHSHYNEDISLLDIGGHFDLSQCYTSTIFKETTGENFKDYLSRYRIKKAKEILEKDPSMKNNELAKMIGCNTVATLFRLFNKYEGISPGQYVKNLKEHASHT